MHAKEGTAIYACCEEEAKKAYFLGENAADAFVVVAQFGPLLPLGRLRTSILIVLLHIGKSGPAKKSTFRILNRTEKEVTFIFQPGLHYLPSISPLTMRAAATNNGRVREKKNALNAFSFLSGWKNRLFTLIVCDAPL